MAQSVCGTSNNLNNKSNLIVLLRPHFVLQPIQYCLSLHVASRLVLCACSTVKSSVWLLSLHNSTNPSVSLPTLSWEICLLYVAKTEVLRYTTQEDNTYRLRWCIWSSLPSLSMLLSLLKFLDLSPHPPRSSTQPTPKNQMMKVLRLKEGILSITNLYML